MKCYQEMDFGPTVLLPTTSATPCVSDTSSIMTMGANKSTMSQHQLQHHPLHQLHLHHPHYQVEQQVPHPPSSQHNNTSGQNSNTSGRGEHEIGCTNTGVLEKSNRSCEIDELVNKSSWHCNSMGTRKDGLVYDAISARQIGQVDVKSNCLLSPVNCSVNVPFGVGQRNSCSLCSENCASLIGNASCPPQSSAFNLTTCKPVVDGFARLPAVCDSPLLNSDSKSIVTTDLNVTTYSTNPHKPLSNPRLSDSPISDETIPITTDFSSISFSDQLSNLNPTRLRSSTNKVTATVHEVPLYNPVRSKRSSSFMISYSREPECEATFIQRNTTTIRHQSDTSLNHLPKHTESNIRDDVAGCGTHDELSSTYAAHTTHDRLDSSHCHTGPCRSKNEAAIDRNEEQIATGHIMVQRAGSVPNEASTTNPCVTGTTVTTTAGTGQTRLKRGSVNGAKDAMGDRRKSRDVDNTTELLTRRTLNGGGSTLSLTADPRSRTCCFCWCCCCSCSCMRVRANLQDSKRPSASLDPHSRLDDISADEKLTYEEVKSWGESFDLLMQSSAGRKVFREFLRSEYSEENIMFWLACEELKQETNPEVIEEKARLIYEDFISILSPREVSLDSRVREIINANMIEPSPHTFDEAQLQIYTLMHRDSYLRFLNSRLYKDLLQQTSHSLSNSSLE